jgi:hypothetical protein
MTDEEMMAFRLEADRMRTGYRTRGCRCEPMLFGSRLVTMWCEMHDKQARWACTVLAFVGVAVLVGLYDELAGLGVVHAEELDDAARMADRLHALERSIRP